MGKAAVVLFQDVLLATRSWTEMSYKFTSMDNSLVLGLLGTRCQSRMFNNKLKDLQNLIKSLSILNLGWFGSLCSQKIKALCSQINSPHMSISFNWTKSLLEENSSPFGQWCIPPCSWYALFPSFTLLLFAVQLPYAAAHVWCQCCWWWISRRADLSNVSLK